MMDRKYQAYPAYRISGVDWLDDLPAHWEVKRTKAMFGLTRNLVGGKSKDYQLLSLTLRGVITRDISNGGGKIPAEFDTYQIVRKKDLIFCLFDIDETPRTIGISYHNGMITGAYNVYGCLDSCVPEYAYYYFMHIDSFKGLKPFYTGLRKVVRSETFSNIKMPVPKLEEQYKIANFLDHETAKIDTLIDKQQQLIKLLKEKRQAVISHAVTKGLNPNAPMRDSGVEWLGEVPAHWTMPKACHVARILNGSTPDKTNLSYWENGTIPWLASGCLNSEIVDEPTSFISAGAYQNCSVELIPANSLLVGMVGQGKTRGTAAILAFDSCINQNMAAIIPGKKVRSRYLYYLFHAMYEDLRERGRGGNQAALNCEIIGAVRLPLPPLDEQIDIVHALDILLVKLSQTDTLGEEQIKLLQERRTALISAAVTGKIDVRDWVAPEPEYQPTEEAHS